jgi:circadian clock protein KaiC
LEKAPTGIAGLDEVLDGGLPRGRPTIVTGRAGCGKTLLSMEFLVHGAREFGEPGIFVSFEESPQELVQNMVSLGFDVAGLEQQGKLLLEHVHVERSEIEETGEYDLEALFIRLGFAIDQVGAKRIVLDTLEALFAGLPNHSILRAELRRLFRWLKNRGMTAVVTAERGEGLLTRHGLEEYISDCVILLDHRVDDEVTTRRLRVVKYRGSHHGTNEYPFLISGDGISLIPITTLGLNHGVSNERISTGVARLDAMLGGQGYYRGSTILVSGTAGAGKSSLAAHLADATARCGERCLYIAMEESQPQIIRNMRSIGLDLQPWVEQGLLRFHAARPTLYGLEMHLVTIHKLTREHRPQVVIMDPITNLVVVGNELEVRGALLRLIDYFKSQGITALFTSLTSGNEALEQLQVGLSSLMDTWILLKMIEANGERNRALYVLKARGIAHSHQVREFRLTDKGIQVVDVYVGSEGMLTGTARLAQEARERAAILARQQEIERKQRNLERKRALLEATIRSLQAEFAVEEEELRLVLADTVLANQAQMDMGDAIAQRRGRDAPASDAQVDVQVAEGETGAAGGENGAERGGRP